VSALLSDCANRDEAPRATRRYSLAELSADFDQLTKLIRKEHPMFFTDEAELERTIAEQRTLLREGLDDFEFFRILAPVAAAVRCGHARLRLSRGLRDYYHDHGKFLPVEIRVIGDRLFVFRDFTADESIEPGTRILAIDDHQAVEIIQRMTDGLPADGTNLSYKYHAMNQRFSPLYHLFIGPADRFRLQLLDSLTGQQETREVFAMSWAEREAVGEIRFPRGPSPARLESSISPERRFASLRIGDFSYYDDPEEFNKPVREFFAELAAEKVGALILDLRGNDGGDPYCSATIAEHLIDHPVQYFADGTPFYDEFVVPRPVPENVFTGELFVLIDGGSFSSTGHLVALLKYHGAGTFIGTETGGSYACNDASEAHSLKHTGLQLGLPRMTFQVAAAGLTKGRGILPDHEIEATIDDLLAGGDPVLEKAIELGSVAAPSTNADADRPHP
jgi:hypothetical protein